MLHVCNPIKAVCLLEFVAIEPNAIRGAPEIARAKEIKMVIILASNSPLKIKKKCKNDSNKNSKTYS